MVWVGVDVGKATHHACVMDPAGTVVFSQKLANDQAAIGQQVVYVPGRVVNRMTGVFRGEAKSDAKDARVIAETARMRTDLTPVAATDDLVIELTRLTAHREDLMADWVRGVNRLRDLLTGIFPALERAFDYSTRSALVLVTGLRLPGEQTTAALIARLARHLLDLDRQIKDTDKLITSRFREHPQAEIIDSLPGLGPILGAEFLVATGGDLATFVTSGRLASYAGLVPVPQDSGRGTGNLRRPKRYNRRLRRVFSMAALSSIKANGPSRVFYDKKRSERLVHTRALLALARRLVDVLWALLRDRRKFTPTAPQPATAAA
ncbi:IS110 family transposase [Amycolatopsis pithecellobii]|uniref:IS110 family transposase n=1 Tax=Amycolatopsis pithecellobii TaxID=664692 RepID=UPI0035E4443E